MQLKESQQREQALSADLEAAKKGEQELQLQLQQVQSQVQAARDGPLPTPSPSHRSMENGALLFLHRCLVPFGFDAVRILTVMLVWML